MEVTQEVANLLTLFFGEEVFRKIVESPEYDSGVDGRLGAGAGKACSPPGAANGTGNLEGTPTRVSYSPSMYPYCAATTRDVERLTTCTGAVHQFDLSMSGWFTGAWDAVCEKVTANAIEKGFWEQGVNRNKGEMICLMHSELSEALEETRKLEPEESEKIPGFTKEEEEFADAVIRIMDYGNAHGLALGPAIIAKHNYNTTRPYKHGKKY